MPSAKPAAGPASSSAPLAQVGTRLRRLAWRLRAWHPVLMGCWLLLYLALAFYDQPYWAADVRVH